MQLVAESEGLRVSLIYSSQVYGVKCSSAICGQKSDLEDLCLITGPTSKFVLNDGNYLKKKDQT